MVLACLLSHTGNPSVHVQQQRFNVCFQRKMALALISDITYHCNNVKIFLGDDTPQIPSTPGASIQQFHTELF
jgi:hypothetical protein